MFLYIDVRELRVSRTHVLSCLHAKTSSTYKWLLLFVSTNEASKTESGRNYYQINTPHSASGANMEIPIQNILQHAFYLH